MKNFKFLAVSLALMSLSACGSNVARTASASCTTKTTASGATITCPDGTSSTVVNGSNGTNGSSCSATTLNVTPQAPNGGSLISCQNGTTTLILNGRNGLNGTNGTTVTPIQFCSASTASYPNTFPEVGFCINKKLYAVYSATDGFLSLIPPGAYISNGINSSCTFTVGLNCQVN